MKAYSYTAYTDTGRRKQGTVVAETEMQAAHMLKDKGLFVSDLNDKGEARSRQTTRAEGRSGGWFGGLRGGLRGRLNADLQMVLTRQMAVLLGAELPVEAALDAVRASGHTPVMDGVVARTKVALLEGSPVSDALEQSGAGFPRYYIAALRAGENAGDLATVFAELADHLEDAGADRAQISTALVYPAFVAVVSLLVCAILMTSVAPEIVSMFEVSGRPLPELTQVVLGITDWIRMHLVGLAVAAVALAVGIVAMARVPWLRVRRDAVLLRLPLVGRLIRRGAAVQYLRTLALVLTSRHAVLTATESAAGVLTLAQFRAEAEQVSEAVRTGESLSVALEQLSFIPAVARQLVSAGEMSARLARMTERSAVLVENTLSTERKRIAALLEPMLMMLVGGFVLVVVLAVLLPIFDLQAMVSV